MIQNEQYYKKVILVQLAEDQYPEIVLSNYDAFRIYSITKLVNEKVQKHGRVYEDDEIEFRVFIYPNLPKKRKKVFDQYYIEFQTEQEAEQAKRDIDATEGVLYSTFDVYLERYDVPNDPLYSAVYGLAKLQCEEAWEISEGDGVLVCVNDSGILVSHEDITENLDLNLSRDFTNSPDLFDGADHGTHVAGTIAAVKNNSLGICGVAPLCRIMVSKIFHTNGIGLLRWGVQGLQYAADSGARVVNNSWGVNGLTMNDPAGKFVHDAIEYCYDSGTILVFAAGNEEVDCSQNVITGHPHVIVVAAVDWNDEKAYFSNYGNTVTVSAPGVAVISLLNNGGYGGKDGTSMASPFVTGVIALLLSICSTLTFEQVKQLLQDTADPHKDNGKYIGAGRVNAYRALLNVNLYNDDCTAGLDTGKLWAGIYIESPYERNEISYIDDDEITVEYRDTDDILYLNNGYPMQGDPDTYGIPFPQYILAPVKVYFKSKALNFDTEITIKRIRKVLANIYSAGEIIIRHLYLDYDGVEEGIEYYYRRISVGANQFNYPPTVNSWDYLAGREVIGTDKSILSYVPGEDMQRHFSKAVKLCIEVEAYLRTKINSIEFYVRPIRSYLK